MIRDFRSVLLLLLLVPSGWSQSAADLAQKFHHHEVYEVESGVVMSAEFASNGLVCEMRVEQTHFKEQAVDLRNGLELDKIDDLLDRLVLPSERGEKTENNSSDQSLMLVVGTIMTRTDTYANIIVQVTSGVGTSDGSSVLEIKWRHRSCS